MHQVWLFLGSLSVFAVVDVFVFYAMYCNCILYRGPGFLLLFWLHIVTIQQLNSVSYQQRHKICLFLGVFSVV